MSTSRAYTCRTLREVVTLFASVGATRIAVVGNRFTADAVGMKVDMTNSSTDVFCEVLALAGSGVASTEWQQNLVLHFCDLARYARGTGGFDLAELPWTQDHRQEQEFFIELLDRATRRTEWHRLHYTPMIDHNLDAFTRMLTTFRAEETVDSSFGDWTIAANPYHLDRCIRHGIFQGEYECRLCDPWTQPCDAPKVWELSSTQTENGTIVNRELRQIPADLATRILAILGTPEPDSGGIRIEQPHLEQISALVHQALDHRARHWLGKVVA